MNEYSSSSEAAPPTVCATTRTETVARLANGTTGCSTMRNVSAPVNLAAALNVLSDNSTANATAVQTAPITQTS